jgi:hypothetical protein
MYIGQAFLAAHRIERVLSSWGRLGRREHQIFSTASIVTFRQSEGLVTMHSRRGKSIFHGVRDKLQGRPPAVCEDKEKMSANTSRAVRQRLRIAIDAGLCKRAHRCQEI